ncbi:hydantoinase/oxoprolinase family protein [[Clostridium] hylemonae]|uniref:Hydantoinase/oxoprolinase n=1 Tax=[Clostridium] hylemonae DSM 15053 TaxID=553973 RepID=C0BXG2_9FIRM|nr:hydantoinase/oxoprolinase family protein [[Clostridium] hylemonae]EEG75269.1 hydantoinase/oxoprolinase [[Clostridium] hylemonae DSM 15053]QEK16989.1 Acetophenone carboxylase gamma subunit [[Clostridium] hylemonae DSM 15053]
MSYRLAADVGGTFTDVVMVDDETGILKTTKVLTTPQALEAGMLKGFDELTSGKYEEITSIVHGTTSGLNSVIERRGAHCALITTKGFRDVYEIARANRPEIYNNHYRKPEPLIPRRDIYEIEERTTYAGEVEKEVTYETVKELIPRLEGQYEAIAVCLINSYINTENEQKVCRILKENLNGEVIVTASHEIARESREYERVSTAVLNAYVAPSTRHHVHALTEELRKRGFKGTLYMMQSSGGVIRAEMAAVRAVQTLMSGPVGGAIGAGAIRRENIIGFDIGGTSFDVSLVVNGKIETAVEAEMEGFPILAPTVNVFSIGAGGGSIAWEEAGGMRVGPQSAGAAPGPVCYDKGGTEPTITDADLVLGHLSPGHFLGGRMKINEYKTKEIFAAYGEKFGLDMVTAGEGVCTIANHKMADAIRELTVRRGIDPRKFSILAFGGAGPMHAALIAGELDIKEVIVPANPGVFSAWGMLQADIRHDAAVTSLCLLNRLKEEEFEQNFECLKEELQEVLEKEGIGRRKKQYICSLDMRYFGQEYTISVDIPEGRGCCRDDIEEQFNSIYERLYGHHSPDDMIEVVNYRMTVIVPVKKSPAAGKAGEGSADIIDRLPGYFDGVRYDMNVYAREQLVAGSRIEGPAIIAELTSTTVVPPKWKLTVDEADSMIITRV